MTVVETTRRVTPDELLEHPDANGYELVGGQLVERHVSRESSRVGLQVGHLFRASAPAAGGDVEVYGADLGYQCFSDDPDRIRKPDVSVVRAVRLKDVPRDVGYMPIPADLAVEVLSPNDKAYEVADKVADYLANGFPVVWVLDPHVRTAAVYTPDAPGRVLREADEIDGGHALPGFRCRVGDLFAGRAPVPAGG